MNRTLLLVLFAVAALDYASAQQGGSSWSVLVGGQVSHALQAAPVAKDLVEGDFLSGYSPANGVGLVATAIYSLTPSVAISATGGVDIQRFSYDLISPPTFGEVQGRTVPGRNLTEFKGLGLASFAGLNVEVVVGDSDWSPTIIVGGGARYWVREHSNAEEAYAAGYQLLNKRDDARNQIYVEAGFGASPFSSNIRISLLYQHTFSPEEPLQKSLVLRQVFAISVGTKGPVCPTF